jgi:hypothetical protein
MELAMSAKGVGHLCDSVFDRDATFIFGHHRWQSASCLAAFRSPWIAALQGGDLTLHELFLTMNWAGQLLIDLQ